MKIYAIEVCTFSCDIYAESYIHSYWSTREKAETYILEEGLLDKKDERVEVREFILDSPPEMGG